MNPGLLIVDKPTGPTSHDVVQAVRRLLGRKTRVGHCGTLDPAATGLLLVTIGSATRLSRYLIGLDKVYEGRIVLGVATDTLDAEGGIVAEAPLPVGLDAARLARATQKLVGTISQVPPAYSAIKVGGKRLYALARAGQEVDIPERKVTIHEFEITRIELPDLMFRARVSSGTYIRSLARDLGLGVGLPAHLGALRRTVVGPFDESTAAPVPESAAQCAERLLSPARALAFLPAVPLSADQVHAMRQGQSVSRALLQDVGGAFDSTGHLRLLGPDGELIGMGQFRSDGSPRDGDLRPCVILSR
jgi:tRNA pseudouridine55 synthase